MRSALVSRLRMRTVAPGTMASDLSTTLPRMVPNSDCPKAAAAAHNRTSNEKRTDTRNDIVSLNLSDPATDEIYHEGRYGSESLLRAPAMGYEMKAIGHR